jgi:hypothetical protein
MFVGLGIAEKNILSALAVSGQGLASGKGLTVQGVRHLFPAMQKANVSRAMRSLARKGAIELDAEPPMTVSARKASVSRRQGLVSDKRSLERSESREPRRERDDESPRSLPRCPSSSPLSRRRSSVQDDACIIPHARTVV